MLEGCLLEEIAFANSVGTDVGFVAGPGCVVAIPVKDEEEHLLACLTALSQQYDRWGNRFLDWDPHCRVCQ